MNILALYYCLIEYAIKVMQFIFFICWQKPIWNFSYNHNGNEFSCHGRLFNCKIRIIGRDNLVILKKGVRLNNVQINITGNCNKLVIDKNTIWTESGRIRLEDSGNTLSIGADCDFRGCFFPVVILIRRLQ